MCDGLSTTLLSGPDAASRARSWVSAALEQLFDDVPRGLHEDVALVTSELATNCIHAAARRFIVTLEVHRGRVTVATTDDAPGLPVCRIATHDDVDGRGLALIDAVSSGWGVSPGGLTKTVWAHVPAGAQCRPRFECTMSLPARAAARV